MISESEDSIEEDSVDDAEHAHSNSAFAGFGATLLS